MTGPQRVQLRRTKGWHKPPNTAVVSRPTKWGNPYRVADYGRTEAVRLYAEHLRQHPELVEAARRELRGKNLACWCRPGLECHADLLMAAANHEEPAQDQPARLPQGTREAAKEDGIRNPKVE